MASAIKPMDVDGREEAEEQLYLKGPLSVLTSSVKTNSMVRTRVLLSPEANGSGRWIRAQATALCPKKGNLSTLLQGFVPVTYQSLPKRASYGVHVLSSAA